MNSPLYPSAVSVLTRASFQNIHHGREDISDSTSSEQVLTILLCYTILFSYYIILYNCYYVTLYYIHFHIVIFETRLARSNTSFEEALIAKSCTIYFVAIYFVSYFFILIRLIFENLRCSVQQ